MGKEGEFCAEKMELTEGDKVRWDNGYSRWELDVDWEASHRNLRRAWKYLFLVQGVVILVSTNVEIHQAAHLGFVPFMCSLIIPE